MATAKNIVLITGGTSSLFPSLLVETGTRILTTIANGGIGFELAAPLLADASKHVLLGSGSVEKGKAALRDLQSLKLPGTVELLQVDVNKEESIASAARRSMPNTAGECSPAAASLDLRTWIVDHYRQT
jgi:NAD(P)-dependent dehydrogenase (short-subunit alcohol dehydrogenase family)